MEIAPEDYMSRDAAGFQDKIVDLMDDDVVVEVFDASHHSMVPVKHVGSRKKRTDTIAGTGLTWYGNETLMVERSKAQELAKFKDVWAIDEDYYGDTMPVTIRLSIAEATAVSEGRAEVVVRYKKEPLSTNQQQESDPASQQQNADHKSLEEVVRSLDRNGLLEFAKQRRLNINKRVGDRNLRAQIIHQLKHVARGGDPA